MSFYPKAQKLIGTFSVLHIQPVAINEFSSKEIIDLFIQEIDKGGFILKASDCKALRSGGEQLINQVLAGKDNYVDRAKKIYTAALLCSDSILKNISTKKIDLQKVDTVRYQIIPDKQINYSANTAVYAKRMAAYMKLLAFNLISNAEDFESITEADFKTRVLNASEKIIQNHIKKIQGELKTVEAYIQTCLLNAMALRFDPHSNYFTEQQNQAFNTSLSAELETFGFYLDESDDGRIFIADMDPGGPAWLSNEINNDDVFISVKIGNETFTAEDYDAATIQEKINQSKIKKIALVLRKANQCVVTVSLIKQVIASSENHVKGYVLKSKGIKTGYISLPSFYTDMDEHNKPGCANDVAKEILKLENDSIKGLIIDLRNNGGGSMEEAMNLAGIFIDEGPLFIFKEKNKKPSLMKDMNRGSIFKKPLVVMINEGSASASELFSNIMKDYHAGVIVGQKSYGKGTAQNVLPLDTNILYSKNKAVIENNTDFIKITNAKFYRLNCSTHQASGVQPDIALPTTPGYKHIGENTEAYYLPADTVVKKLSFVPHPSIDIETIRKQSASRLSASTDFKKFILRADSIDKVMLQEQKVILTLSAFKQFKKNNERLFNILDQISKSKNTAMICSNNHFDHQLEEVNEQSKEFNAKILKRIQEDIFIDESNAVLLNLINN